MNLSPSNKLQRQTQSVRCECGRAHWRWRAVGNCHFGKIKKKCACGRLLLWPPFCGPRSQSAQRKYWREQQNKHRMRLRDAGLTSEGTPRIRRLHAPSRAEMLVYHRERQRAIRAQNHAAGLTGKGTPRKYRNRQAKYQAWIQFRESMNIKPPRILEFVGRSADEEREDAA
jgi:hypothetical protein